MKKFNGEIYAGGFEQGGKVIDELKNVKVEVKAIEFARQIPDTSPETKIKLTDQTNVFEINVITPKQSIQSIKNITTKKSLWCVKGPDFFKSCSE